MCKKIAYKNLDEIPREVHLSGPKGIAAEVHESVKQLIVEKGIKIKISQKS